MTISKLTLGTVQFGLPYGIANMIGQPSRKTVSDIILCAFEGGINCLDTAAIYGQSEELIGEILEDLCLCDEAIVVTKIHALAGGLSSHEAEKLIEESAVRSMKRLRLDVIHICLMHREEDACYAEEFEKLVSKGIAASTGFSVGSPEGAASVLDLNATNAIQIPSSAVDKRYREAGIMARAASIDKLVFVRSIYLQGLLLMPDEDVPDDLAEILPVKRDLRRLAGESGITLPELLLRYAITIEGVSSLVVGVETLEQTRENIRMADKGPLPEDIFRKIDDIVPSLSEHILNPARWNKRMKDVSPLRA